MTDSTILITGASGKVGSLIRPLLRRAGRELRLLDVVPIEELGEGESAIVGSFADAELARAACEGVDLIVHLGGHSKEQEWGEIVSVNIDGTHTLLEAARSADVHRVLLASSIHAVGYVEARSAHTPPVLYPRPDSYYGMSKVAIEALGSLYADRFDMSITSVRIGTVDEQILDPRMLATWLSPADAARIVEACLARDAPGHRIIWGVSDNTRGWVDLQPGRDIGYLPEDDAESLAPRSVIDAATGSGAGGRTDERLAGPLIGPDFPLGKPWIPQG